MFTYIIMRSTRGDTFSLDCLARGSPSVVPSQEKSVSPSMNS